MQQPSSSAGQSPGGAPRSTAAGRASEFLRVAKEQAQRVREEGTAYSAQLFDTLKSKAQQFSLGPRSPGTSSSSTSRRLDQGPAAAAAPQPRQHKPKPPILEDEKVGRLCQLGFSKPVARHALLKCNGTLEEAAVWLLEETNRDEILAVELSAGDGPAQAAPISEKFLVDNSVLKADTESLAFRWEKRLESRIERVQGPTWGTTIVGVDEGDGWLKVGDYYLPMDVTGIPVLTRRAREPSKEPEPEDPTLVPGCTARIHGLKGAVHLNGLTVVLQQWQSDARRWVVELPGGSVKSIRPRNLELASGKAAAAASAAAEASASPAAAETGQGFDYATEELRAHVRELLIIGGAEASEVDKCLAALSEEELFEVLASFEAQSSAAAARPGPTAAAAAPGPSDPAEGGAAADPSAPPAGAAAAAPPSPSAAAEARGPAAAAAAAAAGGAAAPADVAGRPTSGTDELSKLESQLQDKAAQIARLEAEQQRQAAELAAREAELLQSRARATEAAEALERKEQQSKLAVEERELRLMEQEEEHRRISSQLQEESGILEAKRRNVLLLQKSLVDQSRHLSSPEKESETLMVNLDEDTCPTARGSPPARSIQAEAAREMLGLVAGGAPRQSDAGSGGADSDLEEEVWDLDWSALGDGPRPKPDVQAQEPAQGLTPTSGGGQDILRARSSSLSAALEAQEEEEDNGTFGFRPASRRVVKEEALETTATSAAAPDSTKDSVQEHPASQTVPAEAPGMSTATTVVPEGTAEAVQERGQAHEEEEEAEGGGAAAAAAPAAAPPDVATEALQEAEAAVAAASPAAALPDVATEAVQEGEGGGACAGDEGAPSLQKAEDEAGQAPSAAAVAQGGEEPQGGGAGEEESSASPQAPGEAQEDSPAGAQQGAGAGSKEDAPSIEKILGEEHGVPAAASNARDGTPGIVQEQKRGETSGDKDAAEADVEEVADWGEPTLAEEDSVRS